MILFLEGANVQEPEVKFDGAFDLVCYSVGDGLEHIPNRII